MDFKYINKVKEKLNTMPDTEIIAYINSKVNENKKEEDMHLKQLAVSFLNNDKIKLEIIKELDEKDRFLAIKSLKNYQDKVQCINEMTEDKWIADFSSELLNPVDQIKILDKILDMEYKMYIVENYKGTDIDILSNIHLVDDEVDKSLLISKTKDDEPKIDIISKLDNEENKVRVVRSLQEDNLKLGYLKQVKEPKERILLITSLKDDNIKKEMLGIEKEKCFKLTIPKEMTVGMEIECEGECSSEILIFDNIISGWETKRDGSLKNGVEIVSPILKNTEKDVEDIYLVCDILKNLDQNVSENCGGHIHIGANYLKSKDSIKNLIELWANNEKIIYMMSNEKNDKMRDGVVTFAEPLSKKIEEELYENNIDYKKLDKEQFIEKLQAIQQAVKVAQREGRRTGINLNNIGDKEKNTVEFRIPNGTLNPRTWIENANLFGNIVATAQRITEIQEKSQKEITDEEKEVLMQFKELKNGQLDEEDRVNLFLDLTMQNEDKQIYYERYRVNKQEFLKNKELNSRLDKKIADRPISFDVQEIGKSTINVSTEDKDRAAEVIRNRMKQREQANEIKK